MTRHSTRSIDIDAVIENRAVTTHFQPLISIKKRAVLGYEALCRGVAEGDALVPPNMLFALADGNARRRLELDRLCRDKALELFEPMHGSRPGAILSLNLDVSVLDVGGVAGSNYLMKQVQGWGIRPNNIVIELIESNVQDTEALVTFIQHYRRHGFIIALDDVGTGHSNLERLALIQPDVIKIDRSLITHIDTEFYKQEITRSLIRLGQKVGAMVVGEGVEREEEAMFLLHQGVDVLQGFYFARPTLLGDDEGALQKRIEGVADRFKQGVLESIGSKKALFQEYDAMVESLALALTPGGPERFESVLRGALARQENIECLYVLNMDGIQVSDTVCNPYKLSENKRFIYQPAQRGADHSLKDYFLPISAGLPKFTTESYISMASGNLCTTIASTFVCGSASYVLCVDISKKM